MLILQLQFSPVELFSYFNSVNLSDAWNWSQGAKIK